MFNVRDIVWYSPQVGKTKTVPCGCERHIFKDGYKYMCVFCKGFGTKEECVREEADPVKCMIIEVSIMDFDDIHASYNLKELAPPYITHFFIQEEDFKQV